MVELDPSQFNIWVTLPFDKDGEPEFLKAVDQIFGGISQWDSHADYMVRRAKSLKIATDRTEDFKSAGKHSITIGAAGLDVDFFITTAILESVISKFRIGPRISKLLLQKRRKYASLM